MQCRRRGVNANTDGWLQHCNASDSPAVAASPAAPSPHSHAHLRTKPSPRALLLATACISSHIACASTRICTSISRLSLIQALFPSLKNLSDRRCVALLLQVHPRCDRLGTAGSGPFPSICTSSLHAGSSSARGPCEQWWRKNSQRAKKNSPRKTRNFLCIICANRKREMRPSHSLQRSIALAAPSAVQTKTTQTVPFALLSTTTTPTVGE